jgi:hypothetical protein
VWTASRNKQGYGRIGIHGKNRHAHRVSYEMANGPLPRKMDVCHACDNTQCVRPDHLFPGTRKQNIADMDEKGRRRPRCGSAHPFAKLDEAQVREMRARYEAGDVYQTTLAREVGVTPAAIRAMLCGRTWKGVAQGRSVLGRARGETHRSAKLTALQVSEIRARHAGGELRLKDIAGMYGVSTSTIHDVLTGRTWKGASS